MYRTLVTVVLVLVAQVGVAQSQRKPLSDTVLDRVTAAGVTATETQGVIKFAGQVATPNGLVSSTGTLSTLTAPLSTATSTTLGSLTLSGSAQQSLSSLVNINAVNSQISVLLNLNVSIDSTVGSIVQSNLNGKH